MSNQRLRRTTAMVPVGWSWASSGDQPLGLTGKSRKKKPEPGPGSNLRRPAPAGSPPLLGSGDTVLGSGDGPLGSGDRPLGSGSRPLGFKEVGLGYHPDLPDRRDMTIPNPKAKERGFESKSSIGKMFRSAEGADQKGRLKSSILNATTALPPRVHLGDKWPMPPVEDQGSLNSCTANAVIGLAEFLIQRQVGDKLDLSRMFLYKSTRRLLGWAGDTGAYIRTTIKAMVLFGVPPEADWEYSPDLLDVEPEAFHYAFAQNFKAMSYARLDGYGTVPQGFDSRGAATLDTLRRTLVDGLPVAFGFPVYQSIENMGPDFVIPVPQGEKDKLVGGHAVMAVGYDDTVACSGQSKPGALIIRNSWGADWADCGYGYLPYDYVRDELAVDFWTIVNEGFVVLGEFGP